MKIIQFVQDHWGWFVAALPVLGRAYHALANGGGLVGIWRGLFFGTNTPEPVKKD